MTRRASLLLLTAAIVVLVAVAVVLALRWRAPATPSGVLRTGPRTAAVTVPKDARPMPYEKKQTALPADYPLQVPIIDGTVVRAGAPADRMWMYEIDSDLPSDGVAAWYKQAYEGVAWTAESVSIERESAGPRVTMRLTKAGATSDVVTEPRPGGGCRVRVTISIASTAGGSS